MEHIVHEVFRATLENPDVRALPHACPEYQQFLHAAATKCLDPDGSLEAIITSMPEWFLPPVVIIKKLGHPSEDDESAADLSHPRGEWEEYFETERKVYDILKPVQGSTVPVCYGVGTFMDDPALVIHYYEGILLHDACFMDAEIPDLDDIVSAAFRDITALGIVHGDFMPRNIMLLPTSDGRYHAMVFDFELSSIRANTGPDDETEARLRGCLLGFHGRRESYFKLKKESMKSEAEKHAEHMARMEQDRQRNLTIRRFLEENPDKSWWECPFDDDDEDDSS
jgi:tRNA A-37 threonylcarbamoyl transferase component Bud32